jgi:hypothetical protein
MALPPKRDENEVRSGEPGAIGVLEIDPGLIKTFSTKAPSQLTPD